MKTKKIIPVELEAVGSVVRLVSYKMSATIRTGDFQNVIPEITVEGGTIEAARLVLTQEIDFIKEKYAPQPKRVVPVVPAPVAPAPVAPAPVAPAPVAPAANNRLLAGMSTTYTAGLAKTLDIIEACKSIDAVTVIQGQIEVSVKLSQKEKDFALLEIARKLAKLANPHA